jgi:hypothetical protein
MSKETIEIKDYLHLYLGCEVKINDGGICKLESVSKSGLARVSDADAIDVGQYVSIDDFKLLLTPIAEISESDAIYLARLVAVSKDFRDIRTWRNRYNDLIVSWTTDKFNATGEKCYTAQQTFFLLTCGYDLFNLIENNLAIDKTKIKYTMPQDQLTIEQIGFKPIFFILDKNPNELRSIAVEKIFSDQFHGIAFKEWNTGWSLNPIKIGKGFITNCGDKMDFTQDFEEAIKHASI